MTDRTKVTCTLLEKAASLKTNKYEDLQPTHLFVPGCFNQTGLEFITELGNRLKLVTGDKLELTCVFPRLSIAIKRGNVLCNFNGTFVPRLCSELSLSLSLSRSLSLAFSYTVTLLLLLLSYLIVSFQLSGCYIFLNKLT